MSITITTRNQTAEPTTIGTKIELSCPQTAEQKDTELMDKISFSTPKPEAEETSDVDYNPNEESQPEAESEDISSDEASEQEAITEDDEEAIINSGEFQKEFASALENVRCIAKRDREAILEKIREENNEIDEETLDEQIAAAFETFAIEESELSVSELSEYDSCDERVLEDTYLEAIENIRELGEYHQEIFANEICDTFLNVNGREATVLELRNIFGKIRQNFADEAREEFMELNDNESDNSDSDYDENDETDLEQVEYDEFVDEKTKIEIVFVDNDSDSEFWSDSESENETESETDSDTETESEDVSNSDVSDDDKDSDSSEEDDSDYEPGKDATDYLQDVEDEKTFQTELNGSDLNEVSCDDDNDDDDEAVVDIE
jgi:hypothetical protein